VTEAFREMSSRTRDNCPERGLHLRRVFPGVILLRGVEYRHVAGEVWGKSPFRPLTVNEIAEGTC
jgi:hypothetical protein